MSNEYKADKGFVFALKDLSEVYDNILYLGKYDDPSNYVQITIEEAEQIKAEIKQELEKEKSE